MSNVWFLAIVSLAACVRFVCGLLACRLRDACGVLAAGLSGLIVGGFWGRGCMLGGFGFEALYGRLGRAMRCIANTWAQGLLTLRGEMDDRTRPSRAGGG
jgi:hypothetical protein